jgi:hypothetical protein
MRLVGPLLFAFGAFVSLLNLYLSWIRVPLLRRLRPGVPIRFVSVFPLVGSGALCGAMILLKHSHPLFWPACLISLLDVGGIHWFLVVMAVQRFKGQA